MNLRSAILAVFILTGCRDTSPERSKPTEPTVLLIHARLSDSRKILVARCVVTPTSVRTVATTPLKVAQDVKLSSLQISPSGEFVFVFARYQDALRCELWMFDARTMKLSENHVFDDLTPTPYWISANELVVQGAGTDGNGLVISVDGRGRLSFGTRDNEPLPRALKGEQAAKVMEEREYRWPPALHGPNEHTAIQFDDRRGTAVVSTDGTTILTSVEDQTADTQAKSIMLENRDGVWIEHRLGDWAFASFNLLGDVFAMWVGGSRPCLVYNRLTRAQVGDVACEVFDLGPYLE